MTKINVGWRGAEAASAVTISAITINRNGGNFGKATKLLGHGTTQGVRLYVETVYKNKLA